MVKAEMRQLSNGINTLNDAGDVNSLELAGQLGEIVNFLRLDLESEFSSRWRALRGHPLSVTLNRIEALFNTKMDVAWAEKVAALRKAVDWLLMDDLWKEDVELTGNQIMMLNARKANKKDK